MQDFQKSYKQSAECDQEPPPTHVHTVVSENSLFSISETLHIHIYNYQLKNLSEDERLPLDRKKGYIYICIKIRAQAKQFISPAYNIEEKDMIKAQKMENTQILLLFGDD